MNAPSATPKQIAYLTYMGVRAAGSMNRNEASVTINALFDTEDLSLRERLRDRQSDWVTDRFILHPDLYATEIQHMLDDELPEILHSYVRARVVGASERLTKSKIKEVIGSLTHESPHWWQAKNKKEVFYARLSSTYPACVDGRTPEKKPVIQKPVVALSGPQAKGSGCLVVLCALIAITAGIVLKTGAR